MCLQHPCYENLNRIAASKPMRICYGVVLVIFVSFACYRLLQASNHMHAEKNSRFAVIPAFEGNFIHFERSRANEVVSKIDDALSQYRTPNQNRQRCDNDFPPAEKSCKVDLDEYGPCTKENDYGYSRSTPCVFIKFKKLKDWIPKVLQNSDLPSAMPTYLKNYLTNDHNRNQRAVWLSCGGEHPVDEEDIGKIAYYPSYGFPIYFFPSKDDESYLEPLLAVQLESPKTGMVISVKCKIWAQNLDETIVFKVLLD